MSTFLNFTTAHAMGLEAPWRIFRVVNQTESAVGTIAYQGTDREMATRLYLSLDSAMLVEYLRNADSRSPIGYSTWRTLARIEGEHACTACPGATVKGEDTCDDRLQDYLDDLAERKAQASRLVLSVHQTEEV